MVGGTATLVEEARASCDFDPAKMSRAEAEQIAGRLAADHWPPDAARLAWDASAYPELDRVDGGCYEGLAGWLYGLLIRLDGRPRRR